MNEPPTHIEIRGYDGRVFDALPILRIVTLKGIPGFAIYRYPYHGDDDYRVGHIETGAYLCKGLTDGEAFMIARTRFSKEELEHKIIRTRRELERLRELQATGEENAISSR